MQPIFVDTLLFMRSTNDFEANVQRNVNHKVPWAQDMINESVTKWDAALTIHEALEDDLYYDGFFRS